MLDVPSIWAAVVTTATAAVSLWKGIPFLRRVGHILDDLQGEDPRPGLPEGRPGVMSRLDRLEDVVAEVRAQVTVNGGSSMKDLVVATRDRVVDIDARLTSSCLTCPARATGTGG